MKPVRPFRWVAAAALAVSVSCSNSTPTATAPTSATPTLFPSGVVAFVLGAQVTGSGTTAVHQYGHPAAVGTGGVAVTPDGNPNIVSGGANIFSLHAGSAFKTVLISVANSGTTVDGFWRLDLPAATTDTSFLVTFVSSIPVTAFDLQFQVVSAAGAVGPSSTITTAVASAVGTLLPTVVASYSPSPAPFLNGVACVFTGTKGCLWEFKVQLQEFNGVGVPNVTMTETYTFGADVTTNTLPISIPGAGLATVVRNVSCGTATITCVPVSHLSGGTYTYTLNGTDGNGNPFTFNGPVLILQGR